MKQAILHSLTSWCKPPPLTEHTLFLGVLEEPVWCSLRHAWADSAVPPVRRARVRRTELLGTKAGTSGHTPYLSKSKCSQWRISWDWSKFTKCFAWVHHLWFSSCNARKRLHWRWQDNIQTNRSLYHVYFQSLTFLKEGSHVYFMANMIIFNSTQASSRKRNNLIPKAVT